MTALASSPTRKSFPKFVKKARQWVVSEFLGSTTDRKGKEKAVQKQNWFGSLEEANEFYKS